MTKSRNKVAYDCKPKPRIVKSVNDTMPTVITAIHIGKCIHKNVNIFKSGGGGNGLGKTACDPFIIHLRQTERSFVMLICSDAFNP